MKNLLLFSVILFLFSCQNQQNTEMNPAIVELNENWSFSEAGSNMWYPARVPGTVHTDLLDNKLIEDPFYRLNEHELQWIDKKDWEYKTTFLVSEKLLESEHLELDFEGLDTYSEVFLNRKPILMADNMFRSWKVNIKNRLKPGENELRILFHSPTLTAEKELEKFGYQLPASNDQSENGEMGDKRVSSYVRKAPYHFGWDWGPRLVTSGIWRPIKLVAWNDAKIEDMHIFQSEINDSIASLFSDVKIISSKKQKAKLLVLVNGKEIESIETELRAGTGMFTLNFSIPNPQLWWPNGLGEQTLYTISAAIQIEGKTIAQNEKKIGLRTIEIVQEADSVGNGESFYFEINGRPVFMKGANYIPNDVFLTRVNHEKYEEIVKSAAEANMNMLRVWGGGIYENDIFYDLCDQYGILVWQDFMFACSMYPGTQEFLKNVKLEAEENVKRLRDHACLALWCGNNEIEVAWAEYVENSGWGWKQEYSPEQRKQIWAAYDTLFHNILPTVVDENAPGQFYWHSSPSAGMGQLATYSSNSGDMHYWGVWHGQHPFSDFRKYKARFMSEYGFQSFPEMESVKEYTLPEDWDIESPVMASHQRSGIGNLRIKQYMEADYQVPEDFNQFLYVGQLLQAEAIKMAIESHRTDMPYCMGSLYWQLNDCWPVASWSGMDYYGRWKALHYFVKESFENTILTSFEENGKLTVHCISDIEKQEEATLKMQLMDFDGKVLWQDSLSLLTPSNSSLPVFEISTAECLKKGKPTAMLLASEIQIPGRKNFIDLHYFAPPKDLQLEKPEISVQVSEEKGNFIIQVSSDKLVKNLFLSAVGFPGRFSNNFFDVLPGKAYTVSIPKNGDLKDFEKKLKLMHLQQTMK